MRNDLGLSILIHLLIIFGMVITTPFKPKIHLNPDNLIHVSLASMPPMSKAPASQAAIIPKATTVEKAATPVSDKSKAKAIDKPKAKKKETKKPVTKPTPGTENIAGADNGLKDVSEALGAGSAFGGAAIDNASFDYPYWFVQAFGKIERNWSNPVYANQPLACVVYFQVIRSGRIMNVEIEKPSGIDTFDRACERAVRMSEPLPPLPPDFIDEILGIHLEFPYLPQ